MPFSIQQGWLTPAHHRPSPFYNARPEGTEIDLLVIHNISLPPGQFGGPYIEHLFLGTLDPNAHPFFAAIAHLQVSAHLLIRRDGEVVQFVDFNQRAWHAGQSQFAGQSQCNDNAIGIELEGSDWVDYTEAQYRVLADVSHAILTEFQAITPERITGHQYIAPLRKTDPGLCFQWPRYRREVKLRQRDASRNK
ncbi:MULTISPECIES: 1,6-anhydro-N-acetylmuramyl-L-alanine amidase AmpD [unclassified Vibrio]|uniref:1,6-anhydro-N-acetylmuramyl-L-alanine amidase AmpD n=1 Tax=Vibrio sp. HB236076 TaxID=3232307 RepID=A0AB39HEW0_9VIBR|nr:1,6-anhydro-N-acetylmuramyl-L-alanine amidase AmpD [Vibrio sp. HB161653]MDP5254005.1 1,6-anhydro-N-acetylmuramyl-L-alanine amidase AmpD [Vibrio sp. HB161653]